MNGVEPDRVKRNMPQGNISTHFSNIEREEREHARSSIIFSPLIC